MDEPEKLSIIYQIISDLPALKYNQLSFLPLETSIDLPVATNGLFSSIVHLVLNHPCGLDELIAILSYTPRLCRLVCRSVYDSIGIGPEIQPIVIPDLTCVSLRRCCVDFDDIQTLIMKVSPRLEVFRLNCCEGST